MWQFIKQMSAYLVVLLGELKPCSCPHLAPTLNGALSSWKTCWNGLSACQPRTWIIEEFVVKATKRRFRRRYLSFGAVYPTPMSALSVFLRRQWWNCFWSWILSVGFHELWLRSLLCWKMVLVHRVKCLMRAGVVSETCWCWMPLKQSNW